MRVPARGTFKAPASLAGSARAVRIEAYGGDITVRSVKFTITELAFGYFEIDYQRRLRVNRRVRPGQPLVVEVDRGNVQRVSAIEVEWEPDGKHYCFGRVSLME